MHRERWWLALIYVLATLLVQGMHHHDHGWSDKSAVAWYYPGCANLCPLMAGHPSPTWATRRTIVSPASIAPSPIRAH